MNRWKRSEQWVKPGARVPGTFSLCAARRLSTKITSPEPVCPAFKWPRAESVSASRENIAISEAQQVRRKPREPRAAACLDDARVAQASAALSQAAKAAAPLARPQPSTLNYQLLSASMCGIAGQLNYLRQEPVDEEAIRRMADSIVHRGPDDEGYFFSGPLGLGFRRLSIIDLSGGHQPMSDADETVWVVFNGEIYNFKELRAESGAARSSIPNELGHRGDRPRLQAMGHRRARALERNVWPGHLGRDSGGASLSRVTRWASSSSTTGSRGWARDIRIRNPGRARR